MGEIWIDITELNDDYQVSNLGRVKSKERIVEYPYQTTFRERVISERILKPKIRIQKDGRIDCVEYMIRDKSFLASRLVYSYFNNDFDIPKNMCIAHKNKDPLINTVDNLIKVSWSESRKIDYKKSKRTIKWGAERSKRGASAMKRKAFWKGIKFIKPRKKQKKPII